jgi:Rrf2 family protein
MHYAFRTLIVLGASRDEHISAREIAERYHVPRKYLESVLAELRQAGLVESTKGKAGGYRLSRDPSRIRLSEVVVKLDAAVFAVSRPRDQQFPEDAIVEIVQGQLEEYLAGQTIADAILQWQTQRQAMTYSI